MGPRTCFDLDLTASLPCCAPVLTFSLLVLPQTTEKRDAISRTFHFKDFSEALGFMVETGVACDKVRRHPPSKLR